MHLWTANSAERGKRDHERVRTTRQSQTTSGAEFKVVRFSTKLTDLGLNILLTATVIVAMLSGTPERESTPIGVSVPI